MILMTESIAGPAICPLISKAFGVTSVVTPLKAAAAKPMFSRASHITVTPAIKDELKIYIAYMSSHLPQFLLSLYELKSCIKNRNKTTYTLTFSLPADLPIDLDVLVQSLIMDRFVIFNEVPLVIAGLLSANWHSLFTEEERNEVIGECWMRVKSMLTDAIMDLLQNADFTEVDIDRILAFPDNPKTHYSDGQFKLVLSSHVLIFSPLFKRWRVDVGLGLPAVSHPHLDAAPPAGGFLNGWIMPTASEVVSERPVLALLDPLILRRMLKGMDKEDLTCPICYDAELTEHTCGVIAVCGHTACLECLGKVRGKCYMCGSS